MVKARLTLSEKEIWFKKSTFWQYMIYTIFAVIAENECINVRHTLVRCAR